MESKRAPVDERRVVRSKKKLKFERCTTACVTEDAALGIHASKFRPLL